MNEDAPIDAVICWVDGTDPAHIQTRQKYYQKYQQVSGQDMADIKEVQKRDPHNKKPMVKVENETHAAGTFDGDALLEREVNADRRWAYSNELDICLRSLGVHAPWLRRIYIVTDQQTPTGLEALPKALRDKVEIIDHTIIFAGLKDCLPTFNSMAIESVLWRIPGLAERFIYFNDDMFLSTKATPADFFPIEGNNKESAKTVIYGKWIGLTKGRRKGFVKSIHRAAKVNAAEVMGFEGRSFSPAHVAIPMRVSTLKHVFEERPEVFKLNSTARFRASDQYLVQGLFVHALIKAGQAVEVTKPCYQNFSSTYCQRVPKFILKTNLALIRLWPKRFKLICINDLALLRKRFGDTIEVDIRRAIGIDNQ